MITDLSFILAVVALGAPALLLFMLLPSLAELRKPMDCGPRLIIPDVSEVVPVLEAKVARLPDIDAHDELDFSLIPFLKVILDVMPNIDIA